MTANFAANGTDTTPPTVSITAPANGATVFGSSVALAATAADNVGVTKVEFRVDGVLLTTDSSAPYTATWDASTAAAGAHTITATAYDAAGNTTVSSVSVTVPTVSFSDSFGTDDLATNWTQQSGTWSISGGQLQMTTSDSTHHLCVAKSTPTLGDQYVESVLSCSSGYQFGLAARYQDASDYYLAWVTGGGVYLFKNVGGTYTQLTSVPSAFSSGNTVGIKVVGTGPSTRITVYVNGTAKIVDYNPSVSSGTLDTGKGACDTYASVSTTYQFDNFKVYDLSTATLPDTTPPTVSITAPANGATVFGSSVALAATAADNVGVTKVEFRVDGVLLTTDSSAPYTATWDASTAAAGAHTITATAYDAAGNTTVSSVSVTVPTVSFSDSFGTDDLATNWTQQSGTWSISGGQLQMTTSDSTHHLCVAKSTPTLGDQYVESVLSCSSGYQFGLAARYQDASDYYLAWVTGGGVYLFKNVGGTYTQLTSVPSAFSSGNTVGIKVVGTGPSTRITVYVNGTAKIVDYNPSVSSGTLDTGKGACDTYASVSTTYQFDNFKVYDLSTATLPDTTPPTVSITAPANGATVFGSSVALAATAADNVGVTKVEFRVDGVLLTTDSSAPYTATWDASTAAAGAHTITATAYDAAGNTTVSSVSVTVPTVSFSDSFGTDDLATNWTQQSGTWSISGGQLQMTTSDSTHHLCVAKSTPTLGDQYVESVLSCSSGYQFGLAARYQDASDYYLAWVTGGGVYLFKNVGGTYTQLTSVPSAFSSGNTVGIKVVGTGPSTRITVYVNGTAKIVDYNPSVSSGTLDTGKGACDTYASVSTTYQFDNFKVYE